MSAKTERDPKVAAELRKAQNFIKQERYDVAADVLRQLDDPTARAWLKKLQGMKSRSKSRNGMNIARLAVFSVLALVLIAGALIVRPRIVDQINSEIEVGVRDNVDNMVEDPFPPGDEMTYALIHSYCSGIIGYGVETCIDYTDRVLRSHFDEITTCLDQHDPALVEETPDFAQCLDDNGVPQPGF